MDRPITIDELRASLAGAAPPEGLGGALQALWWDARGDWTAAHAAAQDDESDLGSWVHAFLHRREGDLGNAAYWYRRANRPMASGPLDSEWAAIAAQLLESA